MISLFALGSILAIYARIGDEHAISIRWLSKSDYVEMFESLVYSIKKVPFRVTAVLAITTIACIIASIGNVLVASRIDQTIFLYNPSFVVSKTPQFTQAFSSSVSFAGWTASIPYGASITNAMISMINNTQNIQNPEIGKIYTPRTFEYEIKCNQLNMYVLDKTNNSLLLSNGGCSTGYFIPFSDATTDPSTVVLRNVSSGHWSMVAQGSSFSKGVPFSIGSIISSATDAWQCGSASVPEDVMRKTKYGLALYPRTKVSKCVLPDGEIRVLSVSSVQFMGFSYGANGTEVTDSEAFAAGALLTFTGYDDLLQSMEYSMNHTALTLPPAVQGSQPISMDQIRNSTTEAARYMASLGQNFYADYDESQLYVIFDTMDIVEGFQMPYWLFLTIFICMGVFLVLFGLTEWLMDGLYTSSLYAAVSKEVVSQMPSDLILGTPMLLKSQLGPIKLGGYAVTPCDELHPMESQEPEVPLQHQQEEENEVGMPELRVQKEEIQEEQHVQKAEVSEQHVQKAEVPEQQVPESQGSSSSLPPSLEIQSNQVPSNQLQFNQGQSNQVLSNEVQFNQA
ncbi:hypothetical protein BGZ49_010741 [Haplosporangium sp. Z 27]|nr:hypothetical protein BGZ49_010741 [Haplosporangium sp. Z 27]